MEGSKQTEMRSLSFMLGLVVSGGVIASILLTPAAAAVPASSTYVKNLANVVMNRSGNVAGFSP